MESKLVLNSLSNVVKLVVYLVTAFMLTPLLVHGLGETMYGLWVIVLSIMGVVGLADFGFQHAVVRAVAAQTGMPGEPRFEEILGSALMFYGGVVACIAMIGGGLITMGVPERFTSPSLVQVLTWLLLIGGGEIALTMIGGVFLCALQGIQLYWLTNLIGSAAVIVRAGLLWYGCVTHGFGVLGVAVVSASVAFLEYTIYVWLSCRRLQLKSCRPSMALLQELVPFASKSFLLTVFGRLESQALPLLVGAVLGVAMTTIYSVVSQLVLYVRQLVWAASVSVMPEFGRLDRRGSFSEIRVLYLTGSRYLLLLILPVLVIIVTLGQPFLTIWIGEHFAHEGKLLIVWMAMSVFTTTLQPLAGRVLTGLDRQGLLIKVSAVTCSVTGVVAAIAIPNVGLVGAGIAAVSATTIGQLWTLKIIEQELELLGRDYFTASVVKPLGISVGLLILSQMIVSTMRITTYTELILVSALIGSCHLCLAYRFGLDSGERAALYVYVVSAIRLGVKGSVTWMKPVP